MSKSKLHNHVDGSMVAVKSKFDADIIRFSVNRNEPTVYEEFRKLLAERHDIGPDLNFLIYYTDPTDGDLLPINNDNNLARALLAAKPLLRVFITRKADGMEDANGYGTIKPKNLISSILGGTPGKPKPLAISNPHDFRQVSAIIDVDILPETCRRVRLLKHGSDKPLGFYIKDGESFRVLPPSAGGGIEKVPGVFISRLVPGGLAESTGLLAVNDEVLEVNGIEVAGKTLDQVTDMMIANSSNLIITVKPANQRAALVAPRRGSFSRNSQLSSGSHQSTQSAATVSDEDADEIVDLTGVPLHDDVHTAGSQHHHMHHPHQHHHHQHHNLFSHDQDARKGGNANFSKTSLQRPRYGKMSYAEHGPRIFHTGRKDSNSVLRYGEYIIPRKRSEGRLKLFGSCTDLRAWSPNSFENCRYFKEYVEKPLPQGKIVPYNVMIEILKLLDTQTQTELDSLREELKRYKSLRLSPEQQRQLQNFDGYSVEDRNQIEDESALLRETNDEIDLIDDEIEMTDDEIVVPERPGTPEHSINSSSSNYESESVHRSRIDNESLSEYRFEELNRVASSKTDSNEYVDLSEENRADTHAIIIEKESEIIALKNELGAKDVEVEQLKDFVRNLEAALRKKEATLDNLRESLRISQQQIFALDDQLKQGMEESRKRLYTSKCSVDNLRTSLEEKSLECHARTQEIEELRKRVEETELIREERDCLVRALKEMCEERNTLKERNCEQAMDLADQSDEINRLLDLLKSQEAKYSEREKQMERMLNDLRAEISCSHRESWNGSNDSASLSEMANLDIRKLRCALLEDLQRVESEIRKRCEEAQRDHRGTCSKATWKCEKGLVCCTNEQLKTMQVPARRTKDGDEEDDEIYKRIVAQTGGSLEKIQQLIVELKPYQEERVTLIENINCLTECLNKAQNREDDSRGINPRPSKTDFPIVPTDLGVAEVKEKGQRDENEKALLAEEELNDKIDEVLVVHVKRSIERVERIALCLEGAGDYISREMSRKDKEVEARNQEIAKLKVQVASRVSRGQGDYAAQEEHPGELSRVRSDLSTTRRSLQRTRDQLQSSDFRLKGANQRIKDLGLEIERLTKENKGLNNTVLFTNDLAIKVDEMETRLDSLQEENSELTKRVSKANELCAEYQSKLMDLRDAGMKAEEAFKRAEFKLQSLLLGRDSEIDALREEKETAKQELEETKLQVATLTEQLQTLKMQNKNLDFLEAQINEILKLDKRAKKLRATMESMKSHLDERREATDRMEADLNVILEENEKMQRETKRLRGYIERKSHGSIMPEAVAKQEFNASPNETSDRLETPKAQQNSWESVDLAYHSEINELTEKSLNDAAIIESLRRDINTWNNKAAEQEKMISELREANAELQKRMEEIQKAREAERDQESLSGNAGRELIVKTERLEGEIREKDERIEKLAREIKATKEECKNLSEKMQLLSNERTEISSKMRSEKVSWQNKMTELQQQYKQRVRALHDQHNASVKKLQALHEEYVKNYGNPFDPETWLQSLSSKETNELHKRICKSLPCDASKITRALNDKQNQQLQEDEKLLHSDIINLKTGHLKESAIRHPGYTYERRKFTKSSETPVKDNATFDKQQTNFIYQCAIAHSNDSGN